MSETETLPPPAAVQPPALPVPPPRRRRSLWPWLGVIGFLLLAAGEVYLWRLYQTVPGQLASVQAQQTALGAVVTKIEPAPDSVGVQADLGMKLADLAAQMNAIQAQVAADHGSIGMIQANSQDLTKLTARIELLNRLETARMALEAGQALGEIPNAPPALAMFTSTPPPTQAALELGFPAAARAAEAASVAGDAHGGYWSRVEARFENLVTVSDGTHVLIGAPAAGVIVQAQTLLDAGDLAGAVAKLDTLSLTTQAAMGNWLVQARALVAARAALTAMAG